MSFRYWPGPLGTESTNHLREEEGEALLAHSNVASTRQYSQPSMHVKTLKTRCMNTSVIVWEKLLDWSDDC